MSNLISSLVAHVIYLFYVGSKETKTDTISDTRIIWRGFGDSQPVPADKAAILLRYPDVWVTKEQFEAGVDSGKYKKREFANLNVDPTEDDIVMDDDGDDLDAEDESDNSGAVLLKIQEAIMATSAEKKPSIDTIRAALPGLTISVKQLNDAWKQLGGE